MKKDLSVIGNETLLNLLNHNAQKMQFQQNMCFQIQNWATIITLGLISIDWGLDISNIVIDITLHLILIAWLFYLSGKDKQWFYYFIVFRERLKFIEDIVTIPAKVEASLFNAKYYELLSKDKVDPNKEKINVKDRRANSYFYLLLCLLTTLSLALRIYCYVKNNLVQ